ncbi:hypothetical protein BGZ52_005335 [Haplosporangium bisporale]|nr:hypothetical protein BGZ52_005335 [Haplosporangium bisporale]KAF9206926.1 hypothetical protein BGZ59_011425 [Podila verticillata]
METTRSKKQHNVQELRAGTVQRLSQQFLKATTSQPPKPVSPMRYQALAIPKQFIVATTNGQLTEPSTPSPTHIIAETYGGGHSRQLSAPQLFVRPTSPAISGPPSSSVAFTQSRSLAGGLSCSSAGSDDSFVSALSHLDSPKEPSSPMTEPLWKQMLDTIEQEDRLGLDKILHAFDFALVLQTLVTWTLANKDNHYRHDPDVLLDAKELLGPAVDHLNMIQVACFLFNEELALDLLNFVATACEELESKKILYEFMGKLWGDGNTTLHLASFLGMADLTKRLLDLGANVYKMNHHKYKPVDCADENTTRSLFLNLTEVVRYRRLGHESLPTSPTTDTGSDFEWSSFKAMGHIRSPSTSILPLSALPSMDDHRSIELDQNGSKPGSLQLLRPSSTPTLASLKGLLITNPRPTDPPRIHQTGQHGTSGSTEFIDGLLLAEPDSVAQSDLGVESILSPTVITKPPGPLANALMPPLPTTKESDPRTEKQDEQQQRQHRSTGHIPPKLRSYQSSPSIRLYAGGSQDKNLSISTQSKSGAPKKRVSFDPQSLMADASRTGDLVLYKAMLDIVQEEGRSGTLADIVNYQSVSRKLSSLHLAASYNHLPLCQFLVTMGASVNLADMEGWTPMHCAAAEGHLTVFEFLIKEPDADLQSATYDGELLEDVVEDDDLRQRVIDIIESEAQSRGLDDSEVEGE